MSDEKLHARMTVDPDLPTGSVAMVTETIEARGHTTPDGVLNLSVHVGLADADVSVVMRVKPLSPVDEVDENGWPLGFFERVAGSMPELQRAPQGQFEDRPALE